jgi:Cd2+/Zn2+-exporting ATPase
MDCAGCAATVERALRGLDGVQDVHVDVVGGKVRVGYTNDRLVFGDMANAIRRAGYTVVDPTRNDASAGTFRKRHALFLMTLASGVSFALAMLAKWLGLPATVELALLGVATIAGGWFVVPRGVRAAMHRALDMNFLMSVAGLGAWLIGQPEEAAATLFLFAVAELLESRSMDRARRAIHMLMELSPAEATVRRGGRELRVPADDVAVGESVVVRPGEKLPVDGEVTSGRSAVNQAPITGESMPVDRASGDTVFAGSLNGQGLLVIRSTKRASDTTLARIIHAVEEAQASRAPSQRFVDRFARVYTPIVVAAAVLLAVLPPLVSDASWESWIYRALTMLVVACPCALVISTPVSIASGLAGAARAGILIKGGAHLEHLADVTTLAMDKTGTLTEGRPTLTDVVPLNEATTVELLTRALAVERYSEHPLARAIVTHSRRAGASMLEPVIFEALPGQGARAEVQLVPGDPGTLVEVRVGNTRLLDGLDSIAEHARATMHRLEAEGKTAVVVLERPLASPEEPGERSAATRVVGVLAIADRPRPEARRALAAIHALGVRRLVMLTGDNEGTARAIAAELGVDEVHATLLPEDKVRVVRDLLVQGERVAFVGDGVNDAPALATATVGIAMGAAGTDVAIETADVALMADDLDKLALAIRLARRTSVIIRQNIVVALAIKAVFLVLAVGGWATLWMAVAADMGGSLIVVANGLRARHLGESRASS